MSVPFVTTSMTRGPDGNIWMIAGSNGIARANANNTQITFSVAGYSSGQIVTGADGLLWFTGPFSGKIGRMDRLGTLMGEFSMPGKMPGGIAAGPLGAVWFIEASPTAPLLGRILPSGAITECAIPNSRVAGPGDILIGPDQNVWFTTIAVATNNVKVFRYRP